jgi:AcrR family transcriptional regulator
MSLYMYFPSKNEILRSIWEGFFDACFAAVEADVAVSGDNPRVKLAAACHAYVRYWIEHPDQYRAIYMIEDRVEEHERYFVDTSPIMSRFTVFIDLLQASRRGAAETRETLSDRALGLVCGLNGICHMLVTVSEYDWPPAARLVESLLRMVD